MLAFLLTALLADPAAGPPNPDAVWKIAFLDLEGHTSPVDRPYTRYLSLHGWPADKREKLTAAVAYTANAISWRSELHAPRPIAGGLLLKLDERWYAWDRAARARRIAELKRRGVTDADRQFTPALWETLAAADAYFQVGQEYQGARYRGWIDPPVEKAARLLSCSTKFVLRADWFVTRVLLEKEFGGYYSDALLLPEKEADFYKAFLIQIDAIDRDNQLRHGGSVLKSDVANNNRELQVFPSPYGTLGISTAWRTFDVSSDRRRGKSVLEAHQGTLDYDARESFGTLANGLFWWQLYNRAGARQASAPDNVAQVRRPILPLRETRVVNSYKCLECHLPDNGVIGFEDVVRKSFLNPAAPLTVKDKNYDRAVAEAEALEDYYSSTLGQTIKAHQDAFRARLQAACGLEGRDAAIAVVGTVEDYLHDLVTPDQAAREMGVDLVLARLLWLKASLPDVEGGIHYAGNPQLAVLAAGTGLRRGAWEDQTFRDAMLALTYVWESRPKP